MVNVGDMICLFNHSCQSQSSNGFSTLVRMVHSTHNAGAARDDLLTHHHILPACVAPHNCPHRLQADAVSKAQIDYFELRLPSLHRNVGELVDQGSGRVGIVSSGNGRHLLTNSGRPFRVGGKGGDHKGGIDTAVELASKKGADDELPPDSQSVRSDLRLLRLLTEMILMRSSPWSIMNCNASSSLFPVFWRWVTMRCRILCSRIPAKSRLILPGVGSQGKMMPAIVELPSMLSYMSSVFHNNGRSLAISLQPTVRIVN